MSASGPDWQLIASTDGVTMRFGRPPERWADGELSNGIAQLEAVTEALNGALRRMDAERRRREQVYAAVRAALD